MVNKIIFLILAAGVSAQAQTKKTVTLSQKSVAELVLKQGLTALEVNLQYQQYRLAPAQALSAYDWKVTAESGFEYDKSTSLLSSGTTYPRNKYERYITSLQLAKPFTTGTILGLQLNRLSQDAEYDAFVTNPPTSRQTLDTFGLTLEQSLLGNFFGNADRATVNAADLTYQANSVARADQLEDVVLQAIRQFWNTYVAQESFKEAVNSRDRYQKLVDAVRRKTSLGYSNPGDLPQVQAEFETREQKVKTSSAEYLANMENLLTLLNMESDTEVLFDVPKVIPPVPKLTEKKVDDLRLIRSQKLKVEAARESLSAAESQSYPTLNFVGRLNTTGADESAENSYSDVVAGSYPKYYAGLKFVYNFGSDIQTETIINRKLTRELEEARLRRQLMQSSDGEMQAQRKVEAAYAVAVSSEKQKSFRERASQELNRSYTQGRTDISILITAMNNFFDAEVQYVRAVGDYAIALNEWAAVRDELIPDDSAKTE
ncbi:MAG: TolC family protein [Bdellovibrio sp.]